VLVDVSASSGCKKRVAELESNLQARRTERDEFTQRVARAEEIEKDYAGWQALRLELEHWEDVAARFREHEARRQAPLMEIKAEEARLAKEHETLLIEQGWSNSWLLRLSLKLD
jgi:hypothetical protein